MRARSVSRSDLRRALVVNALASPVNVLVPTGVLIAGVLLGAWWLAVVALVTWVALAAHTFFDERTAERVGARVHAGARVALEAARRTRALFTPLIAGRVKAAAGARAAIHAAIDGRAVRVQRRRATRSTRWSRRWRRTRCARSGSTSSSPARSRPASLERRIAAETNAPVRAALESKQRAFARLRERLSGLMAEMDQVVATLQTVQAEIFAADELEEQAIAGQVSELRERVQLVAAGLEEAFAETRAR